MSAAVKVRASSPKTRSMQARYASAHRWNNANKDDIAREYAEQRIVEFVADVLSTAPPLSEAQKERILLLVKAGG